MIYQQTFTIDADGVKNDNVTNIIPCSISSAAYDGYNNYQPTPAEGDEATRILEKINERSSWISTAEGTTLLRNIITVIHLPAHLNQIFQVKILQIQILRRMIFRIII